MDSMEQSGTDAENNTPATLMSLIDYVQEYGFKYLAPEAFVQHARTFDVANSTLYPYTVDTRPQSEFPIIEAHEADVVYYIHGIVPSTDEKHYVANCVWEELSMYMD